MKTNKLLKAALLLGLSTSLGISSAFAAEEGGGEKGNGGSTVRNQLLDLITEARCDRWGSGSDMMRENTHIEKTLSALSKVHWPLATLLRQGIESLDFCMTGALRPIRLERRCEGPAPTTMYIRNREQVAVRIDNDVYVDRFIFKAMNNDKERAYLMIHEAAHDFFPQCSDMRMFRLHTFVKNIEKLENGVIKSRQDFIFQMEKNGISMDFGSAGLDTLRPAIDFMRLDYSEQRKLILAGGKDLFLMTTKSEKDVAIEYCTSSSFDEICRYTVKRLVSAPADVLKVALSQSDAAVVNSLLNVQFADSLVGQNALAKALTPATSADSATLQVVTQSNTVRNIMHAFNKMDEKGPEVRNSRLYFANTMNHLFSKLDEQPIYRAVRTAEASELAPTAGALTSIWTVLLFKQQDAALKSISYGNPNVITGLSLLGFDAKLKAKAVIDDDYQLSSKASVELMQAVFYKVKESAVKAGVKAEKVDEFFNKFNESDLGYKVQEL